MIRLSAVVVAAGRSERFQRELPQATQSKIFIEWDSRPLIWHTIKALLNLPLEEIVVVSQVEFFSLFDKIFFDLPERQKLKWAEGGSRRQDSVRLGLEALTEPVDRVLIHDGARPFLSEGFLKRLVAESAEYPGLIPGAPVVETLKKVSEDGFIVETVDRSKYFRAQTPQIFDFAVIRTLHQKAVGLQKEFTDDAALLEHFGYRVKISEGSPENIKVTVPADLRSRGIHV